MGHETGRPAPAVSRHTTNDAPAAATDPRWAALAERAERERDDPLACPSCGVNLLGLDAFDTYRVCSGCRRHFPLPALERLYLLVEAGTFVETSGVLVSVDPLIFRDLLPFPDRFEQRRERTGPGAGVGEAVITGTGRIGGHEAVLLVLDHTYLGGNLGPVAAEKVVLAMELATARRLPLVALCAASYPGFRGGDDPRLQAGILSLAQWPKIAAAAARLHVAAVPFIALLAHPTTGGVYAGLGNQADLILAEPGAHLGLGAGGRGNRESGITIAEDMLGAGLIDAIVDRRRLQATIGILLGLFADRGRFVPSPSGEPPVAISQSPRWEQIKFARHPERPTGRDFLACLTSEFIELHGDRISADDPAMTCGLGRLGQAPVAIVVQNRHPAGDGPAGSGVSGYQKAIRLMRLAGHFELPILTFIDTAGTVAEPGPTTPGVGLAVAELMRLGSTLPVPIISVTTGLGSGIGAMALGAGDRRLMLQHAIVTADGAIAVDGPRLQAPSTAGPTNLMSRSQPLTAPECLRLGLIDTIVPEPEPAAHADPAAAAQLLGAVLARTLAELSGIGPRRRLEERARRIRSLGEATPEGREAARREIRELHELQRTLSRSLGDLRGRWEGRSMTLPRLPRPTLLGVPHLPRPGQLDPSRFSTRVGPELADLAGRIADGVRARGLGGRETPPAGDPSLPPESLN
ncbi:MAG: acetyl-CoA carboxylase carboxyl transferase subunit beta [Chloroflexia bacterium]|nr:acetyl-CoA carboxylase carboxyl transferase subunit beta [Chloroflexia bacterium]MDQ3411978.1 acetyl-CoA carboxylase carboxyl transferase subunit beta [Chloroflexota bacterium]